MVRRVFVPIMLLLGTMLAGCGGGHEARTTSTMVATTSAGAATARTSSTKARAAQSTVWLCFPGRTPDPCTDNLDTTSVSASGAMTVERVKPAAQPAIDCFYVYPTVSPEPTGNADRQIGLAETLVAETQASQFSRVCRVYAPIYRQITNLGLSTPALHASPEKAYRDVLNAWRDYLSHYNKGRGVVLIGHSQGAYALKQLVKTVVDPSAAQRRRLVSAILLGGQVLAANGAGKGGDFIHVPPCAKPADTGCVIAYSSFAARPPANARFGRAPSRSLHVLCVNPAAPGGGTAPLIPLFPTVLLQLAGGALTPTPTTPWVAFPGLYTARCERSGTASWLQIDHKRLRSDRRPIVRPLFGPGWGLHATDVNIALTELVGLVQSEANAYAKRH